MTDHRRVLREMRDEEAEILGRAEPAYIHVKARARYDALTAALEDQARLRERIRNLRYDGPHPQSYELCRIAVLALLSEGEPPTHHLEWCGEPVMGFLVSCTCGARAAAHLSWTDARDWFERHVTGEPPKRSLTNVMREHGFPEPTEEQQAANLRRLLDRPHAGEPPKGET